MAVVSVRGLVFLSVSVLTAMIGCYVYTPIALIFALPSFVGAAPAVAEPLYQVFVAWTNFFAGAWFCLVGLLLETVHKVQVSYIFKTADGKVIRGVAVSDFLQPAPPGKVNILIMNHRTRVDWLFAWSLLSRTPRLLKTLKIVLKAPLMAAPFFGWTMQCFRFLFLARSREKDAAHIGNVIKNHKRHNESVTLLVFPEGSDLSEENIEKSQRFAEKNGLPKFFKVLNPRTTGLLTMKDAIGVENVHEIIDITMGYTDHVRDERPSDMCLINGRTPRRLHFLVTKFTFSDAQARRDPTITKISSDDKEFAKWIERRFEEKELVLSKFYSEKPVDFEPVGAQVVSPDDRGGAIAVIAKRIADVGVYTYFVLPFLVWVVPTTICLHRLFIGCELKLWLWVVALTIAYVQCTKRGGLDRFLLKGLRSHDE